MIEKDILLLISAILASALAASSGLAFLDSVAEEFVSKMQYDPANSSNRSSGNSSIALVSSQEMVSLQQNLSPGSGYYSSHPIIMGAGSGSSTTIANGNSATSLRHQVGSARELSRKAEYRAESLRIRDAFGETGSESTQMRIDERVTEGRVSIGVRAGEGEQAGPDQSLHNSPQSAWKGPALEIEEEYIGTYNISQNFTLNRSYSSQTARDGWLYCGGRGRVLNASPIGLISADDIFNCYR